MKLLDIHVTRILIPLTVRGIDASKYKTSEHMTILTYLPITKDSRLILVYSYKELYLVDSLRWKILIDNNIIGLEGIVINLA